ncbi:MAG: hypothetical protein H0X40_17110 [Chthoniobacterales bacterium]|nr:hypothetical protein [Chthoniobacterales bacterium]
MNGGTGRISGTATGAGVYGPLIAAYGPITDVSGTFQITVTGVPGLVTVLPLSIGPMVALPSGRAFTLGR